MFLIICMFFLSLVLTKITSDGKLGLARAKRRWFCVRAIMSLKSVEHLPMVDSFMVDSISINDEISTSHGNDGFFSTTVV